MFPTPDTSHVDTDFVYDPAEDSFLLLDTLSSESETTFLSSRFSTTPATSSPPLSHRPPGRAIPSPPLVVELGTGSGVVLAFVAAHARHILGRPDILVSGVDVNPHACRASQTTVTKALAAARTERDDPAPAPALKSLRAVAPVFLGTLQSDLLTSFAPGAVDVLIFNPPYVPTSEAPPTPEVSRTTPHGPTTNGPASDGPTSDGPTSGGPTAHPPVPQDAFSASSRLLELAYAGGIDGMQVTRRFLEQLPRALSERGVAYLLLCKQNRPDAVIAEVQGWQGGGRWKAEVVGSSGAKAGWEKLVVVRIWRDGRGYAG